MGQPLARLTLAPQALGQSPVNLETAGNVLNVIGPQSDADATQHYFESLIERALSYSDGPWKDAKFKRIPYSEAAHGGVVRLLNNGVVDVYWTAPTDAKEAALLPVRIPLMGGLLGYRVSITHRDNLKRLQDPAIDLRHLNACQVRLWTDFDILRHNQFTVIPVENFAKTFELTALKKCDYFPRAIFEGYSELQKAKHQFAELTLFDDTILSYPYPLYVFTAKHQTALNQQITDGLNRMIQDGSFLRFLQSSPLTNHLFPLTKWQDKKFILLNNPFLPAATPLANSDYWITLQSP